MKEGWKQTWLRLAAGMKKTNFGALAGGGGGKHRLVLAVLDSLMLNSILRHATGLALAAGGRVSCIDLD